MNVSQKCSFPERLVHHAANHLGHPEIGARKDSEDGRDGHYEMEVGDDKVGGVQIGVDGRLRQEESADSAADEHRNKTEAEKRRARKAQIRTINRAQPHQRGNRRGNRDDQRRHREQNRRERIHSAQEHMMAPNHVAQEADSDHAADHHAHPAEQRLAGEGRQNVRNDSETRNNRDVNLRVPKEPKQVLPEKRRASGVRLKIVADDQARRREEARSSGAIENQQDASGKQVCECEQPDARSDKPRPRGKGHASERHALCPQVEGGGDEIQRSKQLPNTEERDRNRP